MLYNVRGIIMAKDMITKYYNKRTPFRQRKYYNTLDELFIAEGRYELVGKCIQPSWLGIKDITVEV